MAVFSDMRLVLISVALCFAACGRPTGNSFVVELARPELVTLTLFGATGDARRDLLADVLLPAGSHRAELRDGMFLLDGKPLASVPAGDWIWRAYSHEPFMTRLCGSVCQPGLLPWDSAKSWPSADGAPGAVAADEGSVYLGRRAGSGSGSLLALDASENLRWSHQRSGFGVLALGVDGGEVFVLADTSACAGGSVIYKLDALDGHPVPWTGRAEPDVVIGSLWSSAGKYPTADAMAVGNGRIYLSFTQAGFMAVLDARDGHYVTTVSGPEPQQIAVSTTPMKDADGVLRIADFGVVVLAKSALSFFVMPHDPAWVAANSTHWLGEDERITAFNMCADTMKTGEVQLYAALGPPNSNVQMLTVADLSGFVLTAGRLGGRVAPLGLWEPLALRSVRSLAVDAGHKLWIAEGDSSPPRFSRWTTTGKESKLEREFFVPAGQGARGAAFFPGDPEVLIAAGCEWRMDLKTGLAKCVGIITQGEMREARFRSVNGRHLLVAYEGAALKFYERSGPGDWRALGAPVSDWETSATAVAPDQERVLLGTAITESQRSSLMRLADGRAFFLETERAFSVCEIEGAKSLRKLGEGQWKSAGR